MMAFMLAGFSSTVWLAAKNRYSWQPPNKGVYRKKQKDKSSAAKVRLVGPSMSGGPSLCLAQDREAGGEFLGV
jgi:hypothetical protein